jgi:hypothetical protein
LQGLLGSPGSENWQPGQGQGMPAPDQQGTALGGSGLLAAPNDPRAQLKFAAGLMGLPGQAGLGATMLNAAFQRAQQGEQFTEQMGENRAQFRDRQNLALEEANARRWDSVAGREARAQEFAANQDWRQQQAGFERQRIGLQAQGLADARARADAAGAPDGPKLPVGYAPVMSPLGPVAMPLPGTKPYADAKATDETLTQAQARLSELVGMVEGVETTTPRGRKVKTGGIGSTELWGEDAAKFSQLRSQVIADVAVLRNLGVLQGAEWEKIDEVLPDPTKLGSVFRRTDSTAKAYKTQRDLFRDATQRHRNSNPWLLPPVPQ